MTLLVVAMTPGQIVHTQPGVMLVFVAAVCVLLGLGTYLASR